MAQPVAIDLFAGAGGFGLGFKMAGFSVPVSLEIDTWACDTLRYNHSDMVVIQDDIRSLNDLSSVTNIYSSKPDLIIGGPPCQGFSIAGRANKDPKDPRNSLFKNFAQTFRRKISLPV
ncbi:site-specific DNA-methyltransferase [Calothrix sp. NIES-4071]|nr:site-specific DNA-methyltransferase [Calothrix sp. NIES-4071]BAZ63400.1 site-specific DNA-methyltransferase [Calothrix sp. NIES-4105]